MNLMTKGSWLTQSILAVALLLTATIIFAIEAPAAIESATTGAVQTQRGTRSSMESSNTLSDSAESVRDVRGSRALSLKEVEERRLALNPVPAKKSRGARNSSALKVNLAAQ